MPKVVVYTPKTNDDKEIVKTTRPRKYTFLKYWRIVRYWAKRKYDITQEDLEILLYLYDEELFTRGQFRKFEGILSWDRNRFNHLQSKGYIVVWRKKNNPRQAKLYTLSQSARRIVTTLYKKLLQEEHIPENKNNNPIFKGDNYMDKVYRKAIQRMNMARERKIREEKERELGV